MEYEKHINNLVLGYLKTHCRSAYKVFLKSHYTSPQKHMSHWVAGQTLEVILKNYSRIQDIVHGCLEDTDYCKEKGIEGCSPYYLPEQLLYLLERDRPGTPTSTTTTLHDRSPEATCREEASDNPSEVEATPTHLLPGNISSIMTKTLLQKTDFHEKLARNINSALNVPEPTNENSEKDNELESSIKKALNRTEADPIFQDLLEDLLGPIGSQLERPDSAEESAPSQQEPVLNGQIVNPAKSTISEQPNQHATGLYAFPSTTVTQPGSQQQQFYIVNQPILIPQPNPQALAQRLQASHDSCAQSRPQEGQLFSEQDIMAMPTIFINDRNELTYADSLNRPPQASTKNTSSSSTQSVAKEVRNVKEYINAFGMDEQSPIVKKAPPKVTMRKPPKGRVQISGAVKPIHPKTNVVVHILPPPPEPLPDSDAEVPPKEPRSLDPICTPPIVATTTTKKPTPKSGSHVRSLQFPSPIRKTPASKADGVANNPSAVSKQQATKDLFKDGENNPPETLKQPQKKEAWDAALRSSIAIPKSPPRVKKPRKKSRPVNLNVSDADGKKLEEALCSPSPIKKKEIGVDVKKIVSPSTLCNTASKRNMEVDGPAGSLQARKNISSMLETPLKKNKGVDFTSTPLTPMLKANLKGIIAGDTFSIDTPDFPITPGMSIMEHSTTAYCILKESETNKATEAGVLEEEKKSSVRKADEEDPLLSPKVYGSRDTLDVFNRSQAGKKNLELLDRDGVQWETKSDASEEEQNRTVIRNPKTPQSGRAARITRSATGKSMAALKCQMLQKDRQVDVEEPEVQAKQDLDSNKVEKPAEDPCSSNDSEIIMKVKKKPGKVKGEPTARKENEKRSKSSGGSAKKAPKKPGRRVSKSPRADTSSVDDPLSEEKPHSQGTAESRDFAVELSESPESPKAQKSLLFADNPLTTFSLAKSTCTFSLKEEIEQKRRRMIELEKADAQTPSRRRTMKPKPNVNPSKNRRKGTVPKKLSSSTNEEQPCEVVSQDDFFKKIGSNLHRTNKQAEAEQLEESRRACQKPEAHQQTPPTGSGIEYFWESCVVELQPDEILLTFDEKSASKRTLDDYDWHLDNKGFVVSIPLTDEREQTVKMTITPAKILWEIPGLELPADGSNDPEDAKNFKKRKLRSDSCNSNGSVKKIKTSLHPSFLNEQNIEKVLTRLHGPSEKT